MSALRAAIIVVALCAESLGGNVSASEDDAPALLSHAAATKAEASLGAALATVSATVANMGAGDGDVSSVQEAFSTTGPTSTQKERGPWYEGLDGVKVLHPSDENLQEVVDQIFKEQDGWKGHFNDKRYAIVLTPGSFPEDFVIPVTYYTSVVGVGQGPQDVKVKAVRSLNGANGHATNNFWRSFEGVHLWNGTVTWAVSQGAFGRRAVVDGHLYLSDGEGYSSGGFLADVKMKGTVMTGMQQQWFFRNMDMPGGVYCPLGWNYVFVGVQDMSPQTYTDCAGDISGKVTIVEETPRIAEKPYLVQADKDSWWIYVPAFTDKGIAGAVDDHASKMARKLDVEKDVFVARPGHTDADINAGIQGKMGLLVTPGVYELEHPLAVNQSGFVVLGLGMATLVATKGRPTLEVQDGLSDVRIAGLLLEAGTAKTKKATEPMLRWGSRGSSTRRTGADAELPAGVLSDVFARVGSFKYRDCAVVRADTMIEVNADDVVLDNSWLWHADHDDCGTDPGNSLDVPGTSDDCYSESGLVVTGDRVTTYGLSVEHTQGGDMVSWQGNQGEAYFYQCELPYHNEKFSAKGFVGYAVGPEVASHKARGMGVYIITAQGEAPSAYRLPTSTDAENLITVVVLGEPDQFSSVACVSTSDGQGECFQGQTCMPKNRCLLPAMPGSEGAVRLYSDAHETLHGSRAGPSEEGRASSAPTLACLAGAGVLYFAGFEFSRRRLRRGGPELGDGSLEACE